MKVLCFVISLLLFLNCKQGEQKMNVKYFKEGTEKEILLNKEQQKILLVYLENLIDGIDDTARLYADEDRLNEVRNSDSALEFFFEEKREFFSNETGTVFINKIFLPITGDLSISETKGSVIIFFGKEAYDSSPYINSAGIEFLDNILKILQIEKTN